MAALGGSIRRISLDGRPFSVPADSDLALFLGGKKITVEANGDSTVRVLGTVGPWSVSGGKVAIDHDKGDAQRLQDIADAMELVTVEVELIDGNVWQGKGIVADDHDYSTAKASADLTLMGEGKLTLQ